MAHPTTRIATGISGARLLILSERSDRRRVWDEAIPLLKERDVTVLMGSVFGSGPLADQMAELETPTWSLGCNSSRSYPRGAGKLAGLVRREKIDIVHAIEPIPGFIAGMCRCLERSPVVGFSRQHISMDSTALTMLSAAAAHLCHVTIACSQASGKASRTIDHVSPKKVTVVYNGANSLRTVKAAELKALRASLEIPQTAATISIVARLRRVKGLDILLGCVDEVQRRISRPLHVVMAGDGPSQASLEEQSQNTGVPVHFVGSQYDVAPWYQIGDVFAIPSRREGLGVAALEAMSASRPVIASATGGLSEIVVDGQTGLLVGNEDSEALTKALVRVLADPSLARTMGVEGRKRYEARFTNKAMVDGWLEVYEQRLNQRSSHGG